MICPETKRPCELCCDIPLDDVAASNAGMCYYHCLRMTWFWGGFAACAVVAAIAYFVLA